jgi:hypothetical protein
MTPHNDDPGLDVTPGTTPAWLDQALSRTVVPPPLPAHFRLNLMAAMQHDAMRDLQAQRDALQAEHQRQLAQVRQGYVRLRRETLAWVVGVAFASGALATQALPWLQGFTGADAATLMPTLATLAACVTGLGVWWWRLR